MENAPPGAGALPLSWADLSFHPVGLYDLRRRLGKPYESHTFNHFRSRFEAADLAWFAAGLATRPCNIQANEFYSELHDLRMRTNHSDGTEVRKALRQRVRDLTFDCAALMDRNFGSTTLVIHVPGTTRPESLKQTDYVKADVYFPAHLSQEDKRYSAAVFDITQRFITDIGLPTIIRYEQCAARHWTLPKGKPTPRPYPQHGIQPIAKPPGSSVFTYVGQRRPPVIAIDDDDLDVTPSQHEVIKLKEELKSMQKTLQEVEQALADSRRRETELLVELDRLTTASASHSRAITPSISRTAPHTPNRSKTPGHRVKSQQAPFSPGAPISVADATPSRHTGGSKIPPSLSTARSTAVSLAKPELSSPYGTFVTVNQLEKKFFSIEMIRTTVPMFLWQQELLQLGIADDIVNDLMSLMGSSL